MASVGPRVASVVSLNAARCLIQRRSDLQVLKPLVVCLADRRVFPDAEIAAAGSAAAAGTRRGRPPKAEGAKGRPTTASKTNDCLQKRHGPQGLAAPYGWF